MRSHRLKRLSPRQRRRAIDQLYDAIEARGGRQSDRPNGEPWTWKQRHFQRTFEIFDAAPMAVRHAFHEAVVTFEPGPLIEPLMIELSTLRGRLMKWRIIRQAVMAIRQAEADDILAESERHRRRYGYVLPHVAARATIMRYEASMRERQRRGRAAVKRQGES